MNWIKKYETLSSLGVIEKSVHEEGKVISPAFLVQKAGGSYRMILNLKQFNEAVQYENFKMEKLYSATNLTREGCYMASVDLRHAYYSVPIDPALRKYLKFRWRGQLYVYTCILCEKYLQHQQDLYHVFIDFK